MLTSILKYCKEFIAKSITPAHDIDFKSSRTNDHNKKLFLSS